MTSRRALFLRCLAPRLLVAALFSLVGYYGSGGDAEAFHLAGVHVSERWRDPRATFDDAVARWGWHDPTPFFDHYGGMLMDAVDGSYSGTYFSSNTPAIYLHAVLYLVWEHPFAYVLLTALLSAAATARFVRAWGLPRGQERWLVYNPVSIYFAATHFKESVVESLLVVALAFWYREGKPVRALALVGLVGIFRSEYLPLAAVMLAGRWLRGFSTATLAAGTLVALALLPPFHIGYALGGGLGPVYSLLDANHLTRALLAPLFGLLQPVPFVIGTDPYTASFFTVYGFYHLPFVAIALLWLLVGRRNEPLLTSALVVDLLISYYTVAMVGTKARYFAPFVPLLVAGCLRVAPELRAQLARWVPPARPAPRPGAAA